MRILTRYILQEQGSPFITGLLFFTFILLLNRLFVLADLIITKKVETFLVVKLFLLMLPSIISITVPMSVLISVIISIGRLSSDSEITALQASGISSYMIYKPPVISSIVIMLFMILFNDTLLVYSNKNYNKTFVQILKSSPVTVLEDKIFSSLGNRTIWVERIDRENGKLDNIILYNKNDGEGWDVIKAKWGLWKNNSDGSKMLVLYEGRFFSSKINNASFSVIDFSNGNAEILLTDSGIDYDDSKDKLNPAEMNSIQLYSKLRTVKKTFMEDRDIARYWVELFKKQAIPFSCFVFSIIGVPIGLFSKRSSRGIGFGISIIVFFIYYVFFMTGQSFAIRGILYPFLGVWSANFILLFAGCVMIIIKEKFRN
ncbi:MAG: LptF/LptG family permease [Spirochaetota bacterium]|nr:LptF/LptG family permease [Spirochaetota bacterium]